MPFVYIESDACCSTITDVQPIKLSLIPLLLYYSNRHAMYSLVSLRIALCGAEVMFCAREAQMYAMTLSHIPKLLHSTKESTQVEHVVDIHLLWSSSFP